MALVEIPTQFFQTAAPFHFGKFVTSYQKPHYQRLISLQELETLHPDKTGLNQRIHAYWQDFFSGNFKSCLNYIYPPLLEKIPRKKILEGFNRTFKRKSITITTDLATIDSFSKMVEADEGDFCRIDYTMLMAVQFSADQKTGLPKTEARKKKRQEFMLSMYQAQYGKENAWFDEITKSFSIHISNKLLAIRKDESSDWYFMMLSEHPLTAELIPASVLLILNHET